MVIHVQFRFIYYILYIIFPYGSMLNGCPVVAAILTNKVDILKEPFTKQF